MSDTTETILTFTHPDGRVIDIDHLGIADPDSRGEFAIYHGDKQIGEFMLAWAIYHPEIKRGYELPDDDELIAQATLALADDPRVLTQSGVAQLFAEAAGVIESDPDRPPEDPPRVCRECGCTDLNACITATGPCAWASTFDDNTGVCTACASDRLGR